VSPDARQVRVAGVAGAFAGATLTVRRVSDLAVLADGLAFDPAGRLSLALSPSLAAGTVVVLSARADKATLSGLFVVPGRSLQQVATEREWVLDLASSVVTRRLTTKLAEVLRSTPPGQAEGAVPAVFERVEALVAKTRAGIGAGFKDGGANEAARLASLAPTVTAIEALATRIVVDTPLRAEFVAAVDGCNRQTVEHLRAGGPLVIPTPWRILEVVVLPPTVRASGPSDLEVVYDGQVITLAVPDAPAALATAQQDTSTGATEAGYAELNTTVITPSTRRRPAEPTGLRGVVTVGGLPRAGVVVQVRALADHALIAEAASGADGAYAFPDLPAGTYFVVVAVDGAMPQTQIVTVGS
jgi:hypothetical protein